MQGLENNLLGYPLMIFDFVRMQFVLCLIFAFSCLLGDWTAPHFSRIEKSYLLRDRQ